MSWFKCLIRGENFPGQLAGGEGLVGFYVTRFVEAADPDDAEAAVVQSLRGEPKLTPPPGFTATGRSRVYVEDIEELTDGVPPAIQPGFAWHPMEDDE